MNSVKLLKVAVSAGEPSGDEHLARVMRAFSSRYPCQIRGMAGRNARAVGVETVVDCEASGSLMGFVEVFRSAGEVYRTWRTMVHLLKSWRPDVLVLVDYADFNLRLARKAHTLGIKVLYYITPQVWAWRAGRVKLFQKYVDRAAVIFPFERSFFESHGYTKSVFVGHPFADELRRSQPEIEKRDRANFFSEFSLDPSRKLLAIFPGSRKSEIERFFPIVAETVKILAERFPEEQVLIGAAPAVTSLLREKLAAFQHPIALIEGRSLEILRHADAALLKSGTSNLQAAFYGTPFTMFFNVPRLTQWIVETFVRITQYSIVNVIRPNTVHELIQEHTTPETLAQEANNLLFNESRRATLQKAFAEVRDALQHYDALPEFKDCRTEAERTAQLIALTASTASR